LSWANYDDVLEQLHDAGLRDVGALFAVGTPKPVRCYVEGRDRERRGWFWLHEVMLGDDDGSPTPHLVGTFGIWQANDAGTQKIQIRRNGKRKALDKAQREAIAQRQREQQKLLKAQRQREAEVASRKASHAWRQYLPTGHSPYLERKGVQAFGLRFSPSQNGTVAVPMADPAGRVWGLQIIRGPDRRKGQLEKEYWPRGLAKQGHYHLIGGTPAGLVLIAEGYATAASLHQATGYPVAVAFDAGNLQPVAVALHKTYSRAKILICADDDYRTEGNPGVSAASAAALAVGGKYLAPVFSEPRATEGAKGPTDFNDLHQAEGLHVVRAQVDSFLAESGWIAREEQGARVALSRGSGGGRLAPLLTIDEAVARYWGTYGMGGKTLFDEQERRLVHRDDVFNLLPPRSWDELRRHPHWRVARESEIGFDPTGEDESVLCNLYGGFPSEPKPGSCDRLLELLAYLCNNEHNGRELTDWVLRWLAYPLQHIGAKMQTAIVVHGPQGTGKSLIFEAVCKIYGEYGRILGQEALEDKYNADWAEKKLFILADEVLARSEMFHIKNRLKSFITGDTIRVNPKFVAAHNERNHMNIVFLSNERQPVALEGDDRRHCVIWTPPKLPESVYGGVKEEMDNGGIAAFHDYLLNLDLGDFKPWTKPPMTGAKADLIQLGLSSEERFIAEWRNGEVDGINGEPMPFCPCLGSQLYDVYAAWCRRNGELRARPSKDFINYLKKLPGWRAANSEATYRNFQDRTYKKRKMVIPSDADMASAAKTGRAQAELLRKPDESKTEWLTRGFFAFQNAIQEDF